MSDASWVQEYKAVLKRGNDGPEKPKGPSKCAICCTFFSLFGAFFLFVVASLMRSHYRYIHIHGDLDGMSRPVTYAGVVYLVFAAISIFFWVRGAKRAGQLPAAGGAQFQRLQ